MKTRALTFRLATPGDVPAIVDLVDSAYRGESSRAGWTTEADLLEGQRTDAEAVADIVAGRGGALLIAEADGKLVGCCQLEQRPPPRRTSACSRCGRLRRGRLGRPDPGRAERVTRDNWGASTMVMTVLAPAPGPDRLDQRRGYRRTGENKLFPYGNERFGIPRRPDLSFVVLAKPL